MLSSLDAPSARTRDAPPYTAEDLRTSLEETEPFWTKGEAEEEGEEREVRIVDDRASEETRPKREDDDDDEVSFVHVSEQQYWIIA